MLLISAPVVALISVTELTPFSNLPPSLTSLPPPYRLLATQIRDPAAAIALGK